VRRHRPADGDRAGALAPLRHRRRRPRAAGRLRSRAAARARRRRDAELRRAIGRREWFDPWVFELDDDDAARGDDRRRARSDPAYPWVAGFAAALETFPGLLAADEDALTGPLALLYRHLDVDDLEDADALLAEIETLEPPADLAAPVEELVRATLLLADVGRQLGAR
jgi:uncharacterized protein